MIRSAPALFASILVTTFLGCTQTAPSPPPTALPAPPTKAAGQAALVDCSFGDNVLMLHAGFVPDFNADPDLTGAMPAPEDVKQSLRDAFKDAPPPFQTLLCQRLDGIFVTQGPTSWGYRKISVAAPHRRYLALTLNLWTATGGGHFTPMAFEAYQNKVFDALPPWPASPAPPSYQPASPIDSSRTILAALGHEYGHIYWNDVVKDQLPLTFCDGVLNIAWSGNPVLRKWTKFGATDRNDQTINDPDEPPQMGDPTDDNTRVLQLIDALTKSKFTLARGIVYRLLSRRRPFPSLLAAFSATEQFVETFEMYILTQPGVGTHPLTSLPLRISAARGRNIPDDLRSGAGRANLRAAIVCMASQPLPAP